MLRPGYRFPVVLTLGTGLVGILILVAAARGGAAAEGQAGESAPVAERVERVEPPAAATWQETVRVYAAALTIALTALATAITQCRIGTAGIGALAENPKLFGNILVYLVIPETMVILGFVIAALILL
jgi:V/A-type H+-transporting ATPase subunit K